MGVDLMHDQLSPFGFGRKTEIDLEGELTGLLPSTAWKRRAYKRPEQQKWYAGETISLGIGQGYNSFTMLQLASATSTLVSGGVRYKPRVVREIEVFGTQERKRVAQAALEPLPLQPAHVELINRALYSVTQEGTSTRVFAGAKYTSGGKTGTAQAVGIRANEKYNASKLEEHKRDHSLYIAFAPVHEPTIALAVVVENAGFGAQAAAPIARRVFDYVQLGVYPSLEDIALTRQGKSSAPVGVPRPIADVPLPGIALDGARDVASGDVPAGSAAGQMPAASAAAQAASHPRAAERSTSGGNVKRVAMTSSRERVR
jgi:penicillin-binding protein 2